MSDLVRAPKSTPLRIAIVGYGEVGQTLAADLHAAGHRGIAAWDRLFPDASSRPSRAASRHAHVRIATSMGDAVRDCELVICAVTAGECLSAAREAAPHLIAGATYLDLNSVAPETRNAAAGCIGRTGGRFIEVAVMTPIAPKRIASPMIAGGPSAAGFVPTARALGFSGLEAYSNVVGPASAAKMCRSVVIKGLEALLTESLAAARHYGVESTVLSSLDDLLPADWPTLSRYMIARSLLHGGRRAEEMREAARTVCDAGIDPWMSLACAERQAWAASRTATRQPATLAEALDALLERRTTGQGP